MAGSNGSGWRVVSAEFEKSAATLAQCPPADRFEFAIAGRSNVGKSSLLNALCGQKGLARVSRTPGRTQLLNSFALELRGPSDAALQMRCMDLPGYGYAAAAREVRDTFAPMIEGYLAGRERLRTLVLLVDVRRGVGDLDLQLAQFVSERELPVLLVATKSDKLGASQLGLARKKIAAAVGATADDVLLTSATEGRGLTGRDSLADDLARLALSEEEPAA